MAFEIQSIITLYQPYVSDSEVLDDSDDPDPAEGNAIARMHTYQHDLESLFWLLLWIVLTKLGHQPSIDAAHTIFGEADDIYDRFNTLKDGFSTAFRDSFYPDTNTIRAGLSIIRRRLYGSYAKRSPDQLQNIGSYSSPCAQYIEVFKKINDPLKREHWAGLALEPPSNRPRAKERGVVKLIDDDDPCSEGMPTRTSIAKPGSGKRKCDEEDTGDELPSFDQASPAQVAGTSTDGGAAESFTGPRCSKRAKKTVHSYAESASG